MRNTDGRFAKALMLRIMRRNDQFPRVRCVVKRGRKSGMARARHAARVLRTMRGARWLLSIIKR